MNRIYFSQADKRWANHPYPSSKYPKATIKSGGCGATSGAMIVSSFVKTIYPNQMGDIFRANGLRASTGTSPSAFPWIAKKYGLKCKTTIYIKDAVECLKRGGMCVAYCKAKSLFGDGGHIIVLADIRGNDLIVYDPYLYNNKFNIIYKGVDRRKGHIRMNGVEAIISVANFKKYNDYTLYCYEPPVPVKPSSYSGAVEIDVPVVLTGAREGQDVLVDDMKGTSNSQYWINETVINTNNHIYARANICFSSGTAYMVQVFNRQFWIEEGNIVKQL